jgi:hypothetical protein
LVISLNSGFAFAAPTTRYVLENAALARTFSNRNQF